MCVKSTPASFGTQLTMMFSQTAPHGGRRLYLILPRTLFVFGASPVLPLVPKAA
jgi:hypothetical protein